MTRAAYKLVVTIICLVAIALGTQAISQEPPAAPQLAPFEPAKTMAQVGDQYILKGELVGDANLLLAEEYERAEKLPEAEQARARVAILAQRDDIVQQLLRHAIDRKLMYIEYLRTIPTQDEKKTAEKWTEVTKRSNQDFDDKLTEFAKKVRDAQPEEYQTLMRQSYQLFRVALAMKVAKIESVNDPRLDLFLRRHGTSLALQRTAYMEHMFGRMGIKSHINLEPDITHDQMLAYYRQHIEEYQMPTRARWEQLSVLFTRCPDKFKAGEMIADMGNRVRFGGAPFWAVAQKFSHDKKAEQGGVHDWTVFGDLNLSRVINDAVFGIELNKLSPIYEDEEGLHIIRVLEREQARTIPFLEAQDTIRDKLRSDSINKEYGEFVDGLREKTPIWTIYDDLNAPGQPAGASAARNPNRR